MNQPKIVFFDIDDTLYIKDEKRIPDSVIEQVLPRLKAKGIIPAIATGRSIGIFPEKLEPLLGKQGFELIVSINGQHNSFAGDLISHYPLETARIEQVIKTLKQLGIVYACVSADKVAVSENSEEVQTSLLPITGKYIVDPDWYQKRPIYQMLAFFPENREQEVVESGVLGSDLKIIRWHAEAVDLLNQHNSKARGISDVMQHFGLSLQDAMAFGDGLNDLEMLSQVGCGVAMGNGEPELKKVADFVTLPIEQDGILYALEKLGVI